MANFSLGISSAINTGWEYAKKHGILIAAIYLGTSFISNLLSSAGTQNISPDTYTRLGERIMQGDTEAMAQIAKLYGDTGLSIASFAGTIISLIVSVGLYNLALGLLNGRYTAACFDAFKLPLPVYVKVIAVQIITCILTGIAAVFCIIPAFYVGTRLGFATIYQIENPNAGIFDSIGASWKMTSGNVLALIGLFIIVFFICILGLLCCCVGYYFALAISLFAMVAAYYQLKGNLA